MLVWLDHCYRLHRRPSHTSRAFILGPVQSGLKTACPVTFSASDRICVLKMRKARAHPLANAMARSALPYPTLPCAALLGGMGKASAVSGGLDGVVPSRHRFHPRFHFLAKSASSADAACASSSCFNSKIQRFPQKRCQPVRAAMRQARRLAFAVAVFSTTLFSVNSFHAP